MKNLWKSLCLAICLALCMIPLGEISIEAKVTPSLQDRTANFSRNYTLTTDPGTNMVRIAQAQIGKTYADLGYSEAWCANFVSDCARLASQTAAVPAHAFVPTFSQLIRSAGGTVVVGQSVISTPKAGDIIFYGTIDYPNMYENEWHVGLVSGYSNGEIYTIEGNANGSNTNNYDGKVVASRASWSSFPYYYVLRPNYSGSTPQPTKATINIHANGGIEKTKSITVTYGNKCNLSQNFVMRNGYKLKGWNLYRPADNKWFATGKGWFTASEIASKGYQKHLYIPNLFMGLENSWYGNNSSNAAITNFTFYAIWEIEDIDTNTCSPIASTKYNGKIYELYDNAASWNTANTAATKLGGYLACITSSSENTAIHNLIKNSGSKNCYWIGGSNLNDSQNKFHWVSGESFTYTNWAEKEPSLGTEHFVMMYKSNGLWNDLPVEGANYDSGNMGFIVEKNAPTINFSDVAADAWYVSYVYDLAGKGIINGITPTTFDPEGKITRGQFVKILAYASGDDLSAYSGDSVFADANAHWSKANINWAYTNKIVYGKSDTQFAPDANITRQEMAVMIKRYADYKGITLPQTNAPITFTDEAEIAAWAKEAVSAMQQANIISGFPDGTFAPQGNATRAQAAKMISVFLSL